MFSQSLAAAPPANAAFLAPARPVGTYHQRLLRAASLRAVAAVGNFYTHFDIFVITYTSLFFNPFP
jgi:hypothetical protein